MQVLDDVRYATRQFLHAPGFTATAVLTLSLGIGATTAIFTLVHAVLLRSLPVAKPSELVRVGDHEDCCVNGGLHENWSLFSYENYKKFRDETRGFSELAAFQAGRTLMGVRRAATNQPAESLRAQYVSGNYFSMFGLRAYAGRAFTQDDDRKGADPVAMMSYATWQQKYGGDPSVIGASFIFNGQPFTLVGIGPPGFYGDRMESAPAFWLPINAEAQIDGHTNLIQFGGAAWLDVLGRLAPGADTKTIEAQMQVELKQFLMTPESQLDAGDRTLIPKQTLHLAPGGAGVQNMRDEYESGLHLLMWISGFVLLIACANVANLLLARAASRRGQTAVRIAVGAARREIISQALTESVLLAVGGGVAGLLVAVGAARLLLALAFQSEGGSHFIPISVSPSPLVLGFAVALALLTGVIFGAAPAWVATRTDPAEALRGTGRGSSDRGSFTRKGLLVLQATLSVVLVAGATMLARSLNKLEHQDFGYQVQGRMEVELHSPPASYTVPQLLAVYRQMETKLSALPGVKSTGLALYNPLTDNWGELIMVSGHPAPKFEDNAGASWDRVSAHYLQDLGVSVVRGREFTEADNESSESVAVVNEAFVKRFFKDNEDPIGQHFGIDLMENANTYRIVGVVRDAKFAGWGLYRPARPMFYVPLMQSTNYSNVMMQKLDVVSHFIEGILLVTDAQPGALEPLVKQTLAGIDPNLTITSIRTLQQQVELTFDQERAVASLAGLFGVVALLLAAIGLYGVTAYTVAQRTNEYGIRMALGADRSRVILHVLGGAFRRVLIGLILGLPLAVGAGRLIVAKLYGVAFWDPLALGLAALALGLCSLVAALIPAGRAAGISPVEALRAE